MRQRGEVPGDDLQAGSVGGVDEAADRGRMDDIARLAVVRRLQVERGDAVRPKRCHDRVGVAPGLLREDVDPGAEAAVDGGRLGRTVALADVEGASNAAATRRPTT